MPLNKKESHRWESRDCVRSTVLYSIWPD